MGLYEKARKIPPPPLPMIHEAILQECSGRWLSFFCFFLGGHFCDFFVFNNNKKLGNLSFFWGGICLGEVVNFRGVGSVQGFLLGRLGKIVTKPGFFHSVVGISCGTVVSGK